jgi:putative transposase
VTPFFIFPPEVRKLIYTTNAIERLHLRLRKIIETRGPFPTDEAASKLLWLAIQNATNSKVRSAHAWHEAMNQFAIFFGERAAPRLRADRRAR